MLPPINVYIVIFFVINALNFFINPAELYHRLGIQLFTLTTLLFPDKILSHLILVCLESNKANAVRNVKSINIFQDVELASNPKV